MGVDARMYFTTPQPLDEEELKRIDYLLPETLGSRHFMGSLGKYICITAEAPGYYVHLMGRYYGPGYERGDPLPYIAIAEWLERNVPGARVFYGGDSGGLEDMQLFDKAARQELFDYFLSRGHAPYQRYFGEGPLGCQRCIKPLVNCGGGGGKSFYRCMACGAQFNHQTSTKQLLRVKDHFTGELMEYEFTGGGW